MSQLDASTGDPRVEGRERSSGPPTTRRAFLGTAGLTLGALTFAGTTRPASAAAAPRFVDDAFAGLAAFVLPGNDVYSRRQGKTYPGPGGYAAGGGLVVRESLDSAIPLQLAEGVLAAPGALGYALILQSVALNVAPLQSIGPFANAFANLQWLSKREVLLRVETLPGILGSAIGYSGNALPTLAGLGAYSERSTFDRALRDITDRPVSWDYSNYGGRSDGWPEFKGYFEGRTEVTEP